MQKTNTLIINEMIKNSQCVNEFESLLEIYKELNAKYIIEIGSLMGASLQHWIKYSQRGSTVISIDLPVRHFCGSADPRVIIQESNYKKVWPTWAKENNTKLYLIPDASQKQSTKNEVLNIINDNKCDFLFIDGNHTYEGIKTDFNMYSPLVKGIIAFHDIGINEEGGGYDAWNEIKCKYQHKEILNHPNKEKGIGIIYI